jgi:hypothetical protein
MKKQFSLTVCSAVSFAQDTTYGKIIDTKMVKF